MTGHEVRVAGEVVEVAAGWRLEWLDRATGTGRVTDGTTSHLVAVEGSGSQWWVTAFGQRIPVLVQTWRERVLAEAESGARAVGGPVEIKATLPGLVVAVAVAEGEQVAEGDALLTIEAMKMQNEVRAPRAGTVAAIAVEPGKTVATGAVLMRLEAPAS